jgi:excisionase family DNA binding protein
MEDDMPDTPNLPLAVRVDEAAALLGISRSLAWGLIRNNRIPAIRLGHRTVVSRSVIETLLASDDYRVGGNITK